MAEIPSDIRAAFDGCDYELAGRALTKVLGGAVIKDELAELLDNYLLRPGLETAVALTLFNSGLVVFFVESKPGGFFERHFDPETGEWKA